MKLLFLFLFLFKCILFCSLLTSSLAASSFHSSRSLLIRGGDNYDEERYSRQVYTLGQRAHGLIRSSTVYLDGPLSSGLLYECAKNLALSGVGKIVILKDDHDNDDHNDDPRDRMYHHAPFDDLGRSYQCAAMAELGIDITDSLNKENLLQLFLQRLNPSVQVSLSQRTVQPSRDSVLIAVDRSHETQIRLNNWSRQNGLKFVSIETAGVFGKVFCDFGTDFTIYDADGETPLEIPIDHLEVGNDDTMWVHCIDSEKHDVSQGDLIEFRLGSGEIIPNFNPQVLRVESPIKFLVGYHSTTHIRYVVDSINQHPTTFRRIKIPTNTSFSSLDSLCQRSYSSDASLFAICDLDKCFDEYRRGAILSSFQILGEYIALNGNFPTKENVAAFQEMASKLHPSCDDQKIWQHIVQHFAQTCKGKLTPVQGILGAVGAQEALKAASGVYNPIQQFLLFDCDELLHETDVYQEGEFSDVTSGQAYVLGRELSQLLLTKKIFIVGAGAIGCELLKNLAAMDARQLIITDMDTIEYSNLSRQLLFRDSHIGLFKSVAAKEGISRHNAKVQVEIHTSKIGDEQNSAFDDTFWKKIDVVLNALDNVDARLYVDQKCVTYQKALVDAGTLGSKGNVQVVVPFQSESYGSSMDPQEQAIPVCTLKNFPYLISHTIQWGRDLFEGYYGRRIKQLNDMVDLLRENSSEYVAQKLRHDLGDGVALEASAEFLEDLNVGQWGDDPKTREKVIEWATRCAEHLFKESIESLLRQHPIDSVDEDGKPFWTGARRAPKPIRYAIDEMVDTRIATVNMNLVAFVQNCARLRLESLCKSFGDSGASIISKEEAEKFLRMKNRHHSPNSEMTVETVIAQCKSLLDGIGKGWSQIEFEKDNESNGHVEFVAAASNLRAICYGITPVDMMETRRVAGQIVPAMITTTALVSSLSCIELLKLLQKTPLIRHRNAFVNLALPFFAFTQPVPAETTNVVGGKQYTLWDHTVIKEGKRSSAKGGLTVSSLLQRILRKTGLDKENIVISSISYGPYMIYANYIHDNDLELLNKPIWDAVEEALTVGNEGEYASRDGANASTTCHIESLRRKSFIDVSVIIEDLDSGDEAEIPSVRIVRYECTSKAK